MGFKLHSHLQGELERGRITLYLETILPRPLSASLFLLFITKSSVLRNRLSCEIRPNPGLRTKGAAPARLCALEGKGLEQGS